MTIRADITSKVSVVETFNGPFVSPANSDSTFDQLSETLSLTAATSPPVTKHAEFELAMVAGVGSIDLAALPGKTVDETVIGTGLKVQSLKFRNKSTNANKITVTKGAANGYGLNAAGDAWTEVLDPGQSRLFLLNDSAPDIAAGARLIDVTGTGAQVLEVSVVMG